MKNNARKIFIQYLNNIEMYGEEGKIKDGEILANFIFLKYGGEDMVDVLLYVYKEIYNKNRYINPTISVEELTIKENLN